MLTIIHGDNVASSRQYYLEQKKQSPSPVVFDGKSLELSDLLQSFEGGNLFQDDKTIFIEDLLSTRKDSKDTQDILVYLEKNIDKPVFLWESKDVSRHKSPLFKKAIQKTFNFPKEIFLFLDSLQPRNPQQVGMFHRILKHLEAEAVFYLLVRQFRLLLAITDPLMSEIDEVKRLAPWQLTKLKKQARLFTLNELKNIYKKLYEIDLAQKTGANESVPLAQSIDFLLLEI